MPRLISAMAVDRRDSCLLHATAPERRTNRALSHRARVPNNRNPPIDSPQWATSPLSFAFHQIRTAGVYLASRLLIWRASCAKIAPYGSAPCQVEVHVLRCLT